MQRTCHASDDRSAESDPMSRRGPRLVDCSFYCWWSGRVAAMVDPVELHGRLKVSPIEDVVLVEFGI